MADVAQTVDEFFAGSAAGIAIAEAVRGAIDAIGPADMRITKSQIGFRRKRAFAQLWKPGQYLKSEVPAVLTLELPHELDSKRFKEVAHPADRHWTHHLELVAAGEVDDEVRGWLAEAYAAAG
ncbi:DUF5655 domain-containing protein [Nocardia huaxiensis]|uniref:DUF5655 domain-containing protein n=1 Tax=Nocardia huaxiensis TaxID=2755382 RepID=A0A7D6ZHK1_9NOCA|nr:DUF5655 domain-containing protein [Nocardia huaxiensis]QLY33778.1 hypothetical protein H0264_17450 [Nocardia huaxiensis]UFS99296.1 DUF5655 domain-containing protein [Nocardia huaxiensis]